jgi:hypothetical protein
VALAKTGKERLATALPDEHDHRGGQEHTHHTVEDTQGSLGAKDAFVAATKVAVALAHTSQDFRLIH